MQDFNRAAIVMLSGTILLGIAGCSYSHTIHFNGQVLAGDDRTPVAAATITALYGETELATGTTDAQGEWQFNFQISDAMFKLGDEKTGSPLSDPTSYRIRITIEDKTHFVPFPKLAAHDLPDDIYVSVLAVLE